MQLTGDRSPGEETAALRRISHSSRRSRFSRRNRRSSSRSAVVKPSWRRPASRSARLTHSWPAVSVSSSSLATWPTVLPVERTSSTTSALYSGGRTGVVVASDSISRAKLSLGCPPTRVNSRLELAGTVGNCGGCDGRPRLSLVGRAVLPIRMAGSARPRRRVLPPLSPRSDDVQPRRSTHYGVVGGREEECEGGGAGGGGPGRLRGLGVACEQRRQRGATGRAAGSSSHPLTATGCAACAPMGSP